MEIARGLDVPPFVIFADKSLAEMASAYPRTEESLLKIHGVGRVKYEKYGERFTDIITEYCMLNDIDEPRPLPTRAQSVKKASAGPKRYCEVGESYNTGRSIAEIMEHYTVKLGTVLGHLERYAAEGNPLRSDGLREASSLSQDKVNAVIGQFEMRGVDYLQPVFQALEGEVSYDELKLLRLYFRNSNHP